MSRKHRNSFIALSLFATILVNSASAQEKKKNKQEPLVIRDQGSFSPSAEQSSTIQASLMRTIRTREGQWTLLSPRKGGSLQLGSRRCAAAGEISKLVQRDRRRFFSMKLH
jgi:hypothetical protein